MAAGDTTPLKLIVGLGNPGADYVLTRHNAGFWFADALAERVGARFNSERKFQGEVSNITVANTPLRLLKPTTFINNSGQSVQKLAAYLKIPPESILVVHDDLDLPVGTLRLKWSGGHGGHNGLRDIIRHVGKDFRRLRVGIGHPGSSRQVINYVLSRPRADEQEALIDAVAQGLDLLPDLLERGFEHTMHELHTKSASN